MPNYTFLHDLDLSKKFEARELSKNITRMHNTIALHEVDILDLIQLTFDWERSWGAKPRYKISSEYQENNICPTTWSMLNVDSNWNRENIEKGAKFLSEHLDYLPEFIIDSAFNIMGECLGYKVYHWSFKMPKNDDKYKEYLELGKCHLAVFMMLIEELGKLGIDCRAIKISANPFFDRSTVADCFDGINYINEIKKIFRIEDFFSSEAFHGRASSFFPSNATPKNQKIIEKDFYYETEMMYRQLTFNNLEEFLEMLLKIISRICTFSSAMINPSSLDFSKYYYPNEALPNSYNLPDGELVSAEECISKFLEKLKRGDFIKAYYIKKGINGNDTSKELSTNKNIIIDPNLLKEFIQYLLNKNYIQLNPNTGLILRPKFQELSTNIAKDFYEEAKENGCHPNLTIDIINIMIKILMSITEINITNVFVNNSSDLIDALISRVQRLEESQIKLEGRVDDLEDTVQVLKEKVIQYLENGGNKPNIEGVSKDQMLKIIQEYNARTFASKVRKRLLMAGLILSSLAIVNSSAARITSEPNNEPSESPINSVEDIIIPPVTKPSTTEPSTIEPSEKINMHLYEENTGMRNYYCSIYDSEKTGMTKQTGAVIRYFAFQNGNLVATIATEEELKSFLENNNAQEYTWKSAISCLDYQVLAPYIEQGLEIPLEFTTFFTDYIPTKAVIKERTNN